MFSKSKLYVNGQETYQLKLWFLFSNENTVKQLWDHFRTDDPNATMQFEKFLSNVSENINSKEKEKLTMEEFMRIQNEEREEEVSWK